MKFIKFEKDRCQGCQQSAIFMDAVGFDKKELTTKRPYDDGEDAELAGELGIMSLPTFVIMDDNEKEVLKRMDGFDPSRTTELVELIEYYTSH